MKIKEILMRQGKEIDGYAEGTRTYPGTSGIHFRRKVLVNRIEPVLVNLLKCWRRFSTWRYGA